MTAAGMPPVLRLVKSDAKPPVMSDEEMAQHVATLSHLVAVIDMIPLEELVLALGLRRDLAEGETRLRFGALRRAAHRAMACAGELEAARGHAQRAAEERETHAVADWFTGDE